jgi:hypothetical protein
MLNAFQQLEHIDGLGRARPRRTPEAMIRTAQAMNRTAARNTRTQPGSAAGGGGGTHLRSAARSLVMRATNMPGARVIKALPAANRKQLSRAVNTAVRQILNPAQAAAAVQTVATPVVAAAPAPVASAAAAAQPAALQPIAQAIAQTVDAVSTGTESNPVSMQFDSQAEQTAPAGDAAITEEVIGEPAAADWQLDESSGMYWHPEGAWYDPATNAVYDPYTGQWQDASQLSGLGSWLSRAVRQLGPIAPIAAAAIPGAGAILGPVVGAMQAAQAAQGQQQSAPAPAPAAAPRAAAPRPAPRPALPAVPVRTASTNQQSITQKPWFWPAVIGGGLLAIGGVALLATRKN